MAHVKVGQKAPSVITKRRMKSKGSRSEKTKYKPSWFVDQYGRKYEEPWSPPCIPATQTRVRS